MAPKKSHGVKTKQKSSTQRLPPPNDADADAGAMEEVEGQDEGKESEGNSFSKLEPSTISVYLISSKSTNSFFPLSN